MPALRVTALKSGATRGTAAPGESLRQTDTPSLALRGSEDGSPSSDAANPKGEG